MRGPRRNYARTLGRQITACIFIVLFIILIKKMDLALVNTMALTVSSAYQEEMDLNQTMDQIRQALILNQNNLAFTPPYDAIPASLAVSHPAQDLTVTEQETQIYAIGGGTVLELQEQGESGFLLNLQHGDQATSIYSGMDHCFVKVGDKVRRGQLIATVDADRRSEFQFQLWVNGKLVDPHDYIEF